MELGDIIERETVAALRDDTDGIVTQVPVDATVGTAHGPLHIRGYADLVHDTTNNGTPFRAVWDIKTVGQFGYMSKVFGQTKYGNTTPPEGPSDEHVLQVAIYGYLLYADTIGVAYIPRDAPASWAAESPWWNPANASGVDYAMPTSDNDLQQAVSNELDRVAAVMGLADSGVLARPVIPNSGAITGWASDGSGLIRSRTGRVQHEWQCRYCPFAARCQTYPIERTEFIRTEGDAE